MTQLTDNFSLEEFTESQTATRQGIDNSPDGLALANLAHTAMQMELVRSLLGYPIYITSGYRSPKLNKAINGSDTSQHMTGDAADFHCPGFGSPLEVARKIADSDIEYDQLIYEGTWIHISFIAPRKPRRERLTWKFGSGYSSGIHS